MSLTSFTLANGRTVKLGKKPARHDPRTLQLAKYIPATAVPPPPSSEDFSRAVRNWGMMGNNTIGDCTCACAGHMIEEWTTYANQKTTVPSDDSIVKAYEAVSGYNPSDPGSDRGAVILDVLNYWKKTGISGHKIMAFAGLEPNNHLEIQESVMLFGNCFIGVQLPLSAQNQEVWAVPPGGATGQGARGSWGGHAIPIVQYDPFGLTVVTWGELKRMSWGFLETYCDEGYAVLSEDFINKHTKLTPAQFDLKTLQADLGQIGKSAVA